MASKRKDALDSFAQMRKDFEQDSDACSAKYRLCIDDIKFGFVPGAQKDCAMNDRALYEFNKVRPVVKSVTNDMRQNDPAIKVRAMEDGHKHLAEILNGLIKNIEAQSRASTAYDTAGFFAAAGGYGVIGVNTAYSDDSGFEQDIVIEEKRDPFTIIFDARAKKFDKRDSRRAWEVTELVLSEYETQYPDADAVDFTLQGSGDYKDWFTEKTVRIVKLWKREPITKTIYQLSDGRVLDEEDYQAMAPLLNQPPNAMMQQPPLTLKNQRVVKSNKITWEICSGKETLEGPKEWAGKFIPLVPVWGESVNVEGVEHYSGLTRPIKDSQRLFNFNVCVGMEVLSNQPRNPLMFTAKMIAGYEEAYRNLGKDNAPGLSYNVDPDVPGGRPSREPPPAFPAGFFEASQFSSDLIKSVSNVVDAPIQTRASSGKAIQAVEHQQDVGNFDFIDNLARSKAFVGEIIIDLAPKIYDTERQVMILGEDGKEDYAQLNQSVYRTLDGQTIPAQQVEQMQQQGQALPPGNWQIINDLSVGKYAVTVTVGPSYATQRMETVDTLTQMSNNPDPGLALLAFYGAIKNSDAPGMSEMEKAARKMLISRGLLEPGKGDQPPQPQPPDPMMQAEAALKMAQAKKAEADAAKSMQDAQRGPEAVDNSIDWAKLQVARFDAITKRMALGLDVSQAEREFALDHAVALHDAHMQVATHEQAPQMQAMDLEHQQQMAQLAAQNRPSPNGSGQ